jgi:hypothetical protein
MRKDAKAEEKDQKQKSKDQVLPFIVKVQCMSVSFHKPSFFDLSTKFRKRLTNCIKAMQEDNIIHQNPVGFYNTFYQIVNRNHAYLSL